MDGQLAEQLQKLPKQEGVNSLPPKAHEVARHFQQQSQRQPAPEQMTPGKPPSPGREQDEHEVREQQKDGRAIALLDPQQEKQLGVVRDLQQSNGKREKYSKENERRQHGVDGVERKMKKPQINKLGEYGRFGPSGRRIKDRRHYTALRLKARKTFEKHFSSMHVVSPIDPFPTAPRRETEVFPLEQLPADLTEKVAAEMSKQRKKRIQQKMILRAKSSPAVQVERKGEALGTLYSDTSKRMEGEDEPGVKTADKKAETVGDFNVSLPSSFFSDKGPAFKIFEPSGAADVTEETATATALLHAGLEKEQQRELQLAEIKRERPQQTTGGGERKEEPERKEESKDGVAALPLISHVDRDPRLPTSMPAAAAGGEGKIGPKAHPEDASAVLLVKKEERERREGMAEKDNLPLDGTQMKKADLAVTERQKGEEPTSQQHEKKEQLDSEMQRTEDLDDAVAMVQQERERHLQAAGLGDKVAALEEGRVKENLYAARKEEKEEDRGDQNSYSRTKLALSFVFLRRQKKKKEESLVFSPRGGGGGGDTCSVCTRRSRFSFLSTRDERVPHSVAGSQNGAGQYYAEGEKRRSGSSLYFFARCFPSAEGSTPSMMAARLQTTPCRINRFLLLAVYVLYALLTGRVYFAWPNISNLLFRSEAYLWLCEEGWERQQREEGGIVDLRLPQHGGRRYGCEEQNTRVQQLFIVCLACAYACALLAGFLLDKIGPKLTALFGQCCNCAAWLLLAAASRSVQTYFPAFIVMGIGVDSGYMALLSVANLFPGHEG